MEISGRRYLCYHAICFELRFVRHAILRLQLLCAGSTSHDNDKTSKHLDPSSRSGNMIDSKHHAKKAMVVDVDFTSDEEDSKRYFSLTRRRASKPSATAMIADDIVDFTSSDDGNAASNYPRRQNIKEVMAKPSRASSNDSLVRFIYRRDDDLSSLHGVAKILNARLGIYHGFCIRVTIAKISRFPSDQSGYLEFPADEIFSGTQLPEDLLLQFLQWNLIGMNDMHIRDFYRDCMFGRECQCQR